MSEEYRWPLSKTIVAQVNFYGGDIRPKDLEMLCKYLELMKDALKDPKAEPPPRPTPPHPAAESG